MFLLSHRVTPGSGRHCWFLQVGIKYLKEHDSRTTMLLGQSSLVEILPDAIDGFAMYLLDENSILRPLTSNKEEDGFLTSAVLAFQ